MTELRRRMIDAMLLRGFAPRTQEAYCDAVIALAKHYDRSPDTLSAEELQNYLLHLITKKKLAYTSVFFILTPLIILSGLSLSTQMDAEPSRKRSTCLCSALTG